MSLSRALVDDSARAPTPTEPANTAKDNSHTTKQPITMPGKGKRKDNPGKRDRVQPPLKTRCQLPDTHSHLTHSRHIHSRQEPLLPPSHTSQPPWLSTPVMTTGKRRRPRCTGNDADPVGSLVIFGQNLGE
ncbi:hypothetical protein BGX38DRAFT_1329695 [Terfezia claveryi]|nr:hypothetical protein BGX38DRAFT_1329695 [Terfezia claveryi]